MHMAKVPVLIDQLQTTPSAKVDHYFHVLKLIAHMLRFGITQLGCENGVLPSRRTYLQSVPALLPLLSIQVFA